MAFPDVKSIWEEVESIERSSLPVHTGGTAPRGLTKCDTYQVEIHQIQNAALVGWLISQLVENADGPRACVW